MKLLNRRKEKEPFDPSILVELKTPLHLAKPIYIKRFPRAISLPITFDLNAVVTFDVNRAGQITKVPIALLRFNDSPFSVKVTGLRYIRKLQNGVIAERRATLIGDPEAHAGAVVATKIEPLDEALETLLLKHGPYLADNEAARQEILDHLEAMGLCRPA